jgi:hypothetical protein
MQWFLLGAISGIVVTITIYCMYIAWSEWDRSRKFGDLPVRDSYLDHPIRPEPLNDPDFKRKAGTPYDWEEHTR